MMKKNEKQSRAFQLTFNNPEAHRLDHTNIKENLLHFTTIDYFALCDEVGTEGTPHIHVYVHFRSGVRFSQIKKSFPSAHIESAKGSPTENRDYIRKEGKWFESEKKESNQPETFEEWGKIPESRSGARSDLEVLFDLIVDGLTNAEILRRNPNYMRCLNYIDRTRQALHEDEFKNKWREISCVYVFGETNTNKTRTYMETNGYENVYRITNYSGNAAWDGYRGQDVVIFEEYRSQILISEMLTWLEGYPNCSLRARYADKVACFTKVIIISNIPLEEQYKNVQQDSPATWRAFLRRIGRVIHHKTAVDIVDYPSVDAYLHRDESFHPSPTPTPFDEPTQSKLPFES